MRQRAPRYHNFTLHCSTKNHRCQILSFTIASCHLSTLRFAGRASNLEFCHSTYVDMDAGLWVCVLANFRPVTSRLVWRCRTKGLPPVQYFSDKGSGHLFGKEEISVLLSCDAFHILCARVVPAPHLAIARAYKYQNKFEGYERISLTG